MTFTGLRVAQGFCMAGAFTLTLAYLGERFMGTEGAAVFAAYITGNVASNFIGRLMSAALADHFGIAMNFVVFAVLNLSGALVVFLSLERAPQARTALLRQSTIIRALADHLDNPRLMSAFAVGFCILFAFIGTFTYVNFVLARRPIGLGMMAIGFVYFVFLPSMFTTPAAGGFVRRFGSRMTVWVGLAVAVAGLPLLIAPSISPVAAGLMLVGVGTFFAQAAATGFVGRIATTNRGVASGLYLASYFSGGLVGSAVLGQIFDRLGWGACVTCIGLALVLSMVFATQMRSAAATSR
jgi:predicted MFS family arabinose efflux permease